MFHCLLIWKNLVKKIIVYSEETSKEDKPSRKKNYDTLFQPLNKKLAQDGKTMFEHQKQKISIQIWITWTGSNNYDEDKQTKFNLHAVR